MEISTELPSDFSTDDLYTNSLYRRFEFNTILNSSVLKLLFILKQLCFVLESLVHSFLPRYEENIILSLMFVILYVFCDPELDRQGKLQLSLPQKLPVLNVFLRFRVYYLQVNGIIGWCSMWRLLQTSKIANFLFEIDIITVRLENFNLIQLYSDRFNPVAI